MREQTHILGNNALFHAKNRLKTTDSDSFSIVSSNDYLIRLDIRPSRALLQREYAEIAQILLDSGHWIPEKVSFTVREGVLVVALASFVAASPL